ncbi:GatB/YqeY domain-containing protein [Lichenicoccus sp.]|uniref:GatB/YqeY domain-containing protein n=1 Tax=Lichenicoccus sp. TaxID=2781899 RepID=UPI003D0E0725
MTETVSLRSRFTEDLKTAMKAGDAARVSSLRMILARLKDLDIAGRPKGVAQIDEPAIVGALRGMVKSRAEAAALYVQGGRPELAAKEEAETAIIEGYLPAPMDDQALQGAVAAAIEATGAANVRDTGRVMAALKAAHGSDLDMGRAGAAVKARLG